MDTSDFRAKLDAIASGFQRTAVLATALRADVFSRLQAPRPADAVARDLGWDPRGTRMLLDGLVALELVEKREGDYVNTPEGASTLIPGAPEDQTHILRHKTGSWDAWGRLEEAVRTGEAVPKQGPDRSPEELRAFICGMADIARFSAEAVVEAVDASHCRRLLDVGGGPGSYSIAFLRRYPELRATVFDLPDVLPIAGEEAEKAGVADRLALQEGDLATDPLGTGYDLVLVSNIIHSWGPEMCRALVVKCHEALAPGGRLVIKDFIVDPGRTGPPFSLMFALHMLVHTGEGDTYTLDDVRAWTEAAGFEGGEFMDLTPQSRLWVVRK
jgi:SAM-dependent methyltransferase